MMAQILLVVSLLLVPFLTWAQSVTSFTSSATSINSGQLVSFVWQTTGTSGVNFQLPNCPSGVRVYKDNGSELNCGDKLTNLATNAGLNLIIVNYTANVFNFLATLIPKEPSGDENLVAKVSVSVAVNPATSALNNVSANSLVINSGEPVIISWETALGVTGVNFLLDCARDTSVAFYPNSNFIDDNRVRCGQYVFTDAKLFPPPAFIYVKNLSHATTTATLIVVPYIKNFYNASLSKKLDIIVSPPPPVTTPAIISFTASPTIVESESTITLTWNAVGVRGVNVRLNNCPSGLNYKTADLSAYQTCTISNNIFEKNLSPSDSTTIKLNYNGPGSAMIALSLVPTNDSNTYDFTLAKTVYLTVNPPKPSVVSSPPTSSTSTPASAEKAIFSRNLYFGLRNNDEVKLLQKILTQAGVYNGPITGNFLTLTREAVKKFQAKYGIATTGFVGPLTRAKLNSL